MKRLTFLLFILIIILPTQAQQQSDRPLILPMESPPSPSTWMLGQPYGNTIGAYNFAERWYSAGQGIHFGIDYVMPCGTPLVAVADGVVEFVDNLSFGSAPHNLILSHPQLGLTSLYGHLLMTPTLQRGQPVRQGDIVGFSGDPDSTCTSRPHLHYELRSSNYSTTFNPVPYTDASWHSLALIGGFSYPLFQQNLDNARQWMSIEEQPNVTFGGFQLNNYVNAYPRRFEDRPPTMPPLNRQLGQLAPNATVRMEPVSFDACCWNTYWHPTNGDLFYTIDGGPGQPASLMEWSASTKQPINTVGLAPPPIRSADWQYEITTVNNVRVVQRLSDGLSVQLPIQDTIPAISANNSFILWMAQEAPLFGEDEVTVSMFVSTLAGTEARQILTMTNIGATWLDDSRLLISTRDERTRTYFVYDVRDDSLFELGTWRELRGLTIAPGGGRLMFYINYQDNPADDGIYTIETIEGAQAQKMPFFGAWRWRDTDSLYYVPFTPESDIHQLAYYHIPTGENRFLTQPDTQPFTIMNGDWDVSADGQHILFHNATDRNLWMLSILDG